MSGTVRVNGRALRQRILDLQISDRAFAVLTGVGQATVRSATADGLLAGHLTVATLRRFLDETGLNAADLLDDAQSPDQADRGQPDDDSGMLAQALLGDLRMHPRERLCAALGWTLDRLETAMTGLDTHVAGVGLRVHANSMGVTLRPADHRAEDAVRRLQQLRDTDEGLDNGDARLLRRVLLGDTGRGDIRQGDRPKLASLHRRGVLDVAEGGSATGGRIRLSADTAYAFQVE